MKVRRVKRWVGGGGGVQEGPMVDTGGIRIYVQGNLEGDLVGGKGKAEWEVPQ